MSERIEIKETPKLGLTKETRNFMKETTKELISYNRKLAAESAKFLLSNMKRQMKVSGFAKKCKKDYEALLASPSITVDEQKYWVLRYGPHALKVAPPRNFPTGYTVFDSGNQVIDDLEKCKEICKLYRIWEEFYLRPFMIPRCKTMIRWVADVKERIFGDVCKRRQTNYSGIEGSEEELRALKELDEEVALFHEADNELLTLEEELCDLQFDLFEHPSDANIHDFIKLICRLKELMPLEQQYLERRLDAWQKYKQLLERKYKVDIEISLSMQDLSVAAFIDLVKYTLFRRIIPEATLTKLSVTALKNIVTAKGSEAILNLLVHYGGLKSLERQSQNHTNQLNAVNGYLKIWETEVPSEMIRLL